MKANLYYFPHAGASSLTYKNICNYIDSEINVKVLDYPGHGQNIQKPFCKTLEELLTYLYGTIKQDAVDHVPYFLSGHCIGALIAYELTRMIAEKNEFELPKALIISGHGAPNRIASEHLDQRSDDQLLDYLIENNQIDPQMKNENVRKFVIDLILNPIRFDSVLYDNYQMGNPAFQLPIRLDVLYGEEDDRFPIDTIQDWEKYCIYPVEYHVFPGNHYFLQTDEKRYFEEINRFMEYVLKEV